MMNKVALIAIGYNKVKSLLRLLESLNRAEYEGDEVPLIISMDYSGSDDVKKAAEAFEWSHGTKIIRAFSERQGLKKHILSCGDYLEEYDAVFVFEDDLMVSPYFYKFGKKCINYYGKNEEIEGISLYSPKWNQNANFPFEPLKKEHDTYFMQYAQSWGQIWLKKSWKEFKKWYECNTDFFAKEKNPHIPAVLYTWGENSWLKYHIVYCALKKRYFVYPYSSFTTVFVENGTHFGTDITRFHTELMVCDINHYRLAPFGEEASFYDSCFENEQTAQYLEESYRQVTMDLYGCRNQSLNTKYLLSTNALPFRIEKEFGLQLHPIELNISMKLEGKGIYLYDTSVEERRKKKDYSRQIVRKWDYFMRDRFLMWNEILPLCRQKISNLFHIALRALKH